MSYECFLIQVRINKMFFQGLIFRRESSHQQQSEMATFPRHKRRVTITNACNGNTASQV